MRFTSGTVARIAVIAALGFVMSCSNERLSTPRSTHSGVTDIGLPAAPGGPGSHSYCASDRPEVFPIDGVAGTATFTSLKTVYNTDFAVAGVGGLRDVGSGMITLAGVTGPVSEAYLFWNGPTNSMDPGINADLLVNGTAVTGTNVGFSHDNCWGYDNTQSYRADVTDIVQMTGNGVYLLTGLKFDGPMVAEGANVNGASLVVFFNDGDLTNNRDVVLYNGNDSNVPSSFDPAGWDVTLSGLVYLSGVARIQLHVADGQYGDAYFEDDVLVNGSVIAPGPAIFEGTSVPSANNGPLDNGNLWDIRRWDVTSLLSPGVNDLNLTTDFLFGDCLGLVVVLFDLPAGSAPGEAAFFTGGGTVDPDRNFGFNAGPRGPGETAKGQLQFNDKGAGLKVHSTSLDFFNSGGDCAIFAGECRVNNEPGFTYQAFVCDLDEPGRGVDVFMLTVWDDGGMVILQVADTISGGNIQRHDLMEMLPAALNLGE